MDGRDRSGKPSGPDWLSYLGELRIFAELGSLAPSLPALLSAPRGDGHPVLVLPGILTGDESTFLLRRYLEELGHVTHPWKQGHNWGPSPALHDALRERLKELSIRYQRRVSIVGWSLGGVFARELARELPSHVRQVITLGSPFGTARIISDDETPESLERRRCPPPVPCTSIYSKSDGVIAWEACREQEAENTDNIEVTSTHIGMGFNPLVLWAIADRLSLPEDEWYPFDREGMHRLFYG